MRDVTGYGYLATTVAFTVYGQLVYKWRVDQADDIPRDGSGRGEFLLRLATDPWVVSVFVAAGLAAVAYAASLRYFDLAHAYPLMSLSFVGVLLFSGLLLDEPVTVPRLVGVALIVAGVAVGSQS